MTKMIIIVSSMLLLVISCGSKQEGPDDSLIRAICQEHHFEVEDITLIGTYDGDSIKKVITNYINAVKEAETIVADSALLEYLCPNCYSQISHLEYFIERCNFSYLNYEVDGYFGENDDCIIKRHVLVPTNKEQKYTIYSKFAEIDGWETEEIDFKNSLEDFNKFNAKISSIKKMSKEELQKKNEERLAEIAAAEEEYRNSPHSWEDVARILKKQGCSVIGIFEGNGNCSANLIIYQKAGSLYISTCNISNEPVDFKYADRLQKLGANTYQHKEPGDDMPEKYVVNGPTLISYCFNPDVYEWVEMGIYNKVY